ncbi:hypothetical protein CAC42_8051 [Sphaceloma murrayae]|uniref:Uncharacterized protein n=1 Tax=Sphaceloma murrayae TaxID=2082308 RepID=A0A2K1QR03_9PEZI|nr:hypothetical protein CAC42_8051 [Sphaceloma murrayae]
MSTSTLDYPAILANATSPSAFTVVKSASMAAADIVVAAIGVAKLALIDKCLKKVYECCCGSPAITPDEKQDKDPERMSATEM